jgi:cell wall assembly regulator SMI1
MAVLRGDAATMRRAIELGMPVNKPIMKEFSSRVTPLHYAVDRQAKPAVVAALIDAGADVNARRAKEELFHTPLMIAAYRGRLDLVNLLLAAGADPHLRAPHGTSALANAGEGKTAAYEAVMGRLLAAGAKPDAEALVAAARHGTPKMIRMLIEAGADVNEVSRWGTALHLAVDNKRADNVEALLAAGADPTLKLPEDRRTYAGISPLDLARSTKLKKLIPMLEAARGHRPVPTPTAAVALPSDVHVTWDRLKKALTAADPAIKASLKKGVIEPRLGALEAALGVRLPADVRTSYLLHDGQKAGADGLFAKGFADLEAEYALLSVSELRDEWSTWMRMTQRGEFAQRTANPDGGVGADWWNPGWVPFASDGGGDSLCVDLAPSDGGTSGQVILMRHDHASRPRIASSFVELLDRLAAYYEDEVGAE